MKDLKIKSKVRDFKVKFTNNFDFVNDFLSYPYYVVIVGSIVYDIYKKKIFDKFPRKNLIVLNLDEKRKTLETVNKIYDKLLSNSAKKNLTIISFGGGINQDVVGFAASTLYRGINWIYIPTTLLAQADSAIGLKTSLNFHSYKNVLGTFYPPSEIFINVNFLKTLKNKDYYSGIGEILKFLLMQKNSYKKINNIISEINILKKRGNNNHIIKIIKKSIKIKLSYMKGDEFDTGRRNLLNYGHELGHALESTSNFEIPHGIAVIIGIIFANLVSYNRGYINKNKFYNIYEKLLFPSIPFGDFKLTKNYLNESKLLDRLKKDKKRISNDLPLVLPDKKHNLFKITNFTPQEFNHNLKKLTNLLKEKAVIKE